MGDRLSQTVGAATTRYVLDLGAGLTQVLADGTNTYLYGNDRLAQYQAGMQYFGADGLGSVRQLYDASGQVVGNSRYDPYGTLMSQSGATSIFAFAGEQQDATGLTYLRARYYSAAQGRFTTRDVWEGDPNLPMSYNAWNYVDGDPANLTDPSGQDPYWCDRSSDPILCRREYTRGLWRSIDPLYSDWDLQSSEMLKLTPRNNPYEKGSHATAWALVVAQNQYDDKIMEYARLYLSEGDLQVAKWIKRQISTESDFYVRAFNPEFVAKGLMQVRQKAYDEVVQKRNPGSGELYDANYNLKVGMLYLSIVREELAKQDSDYGWTIDSLEERWKLIFAGYNAGYPTIKSLRTQVWSDRGGRPTPTLIPIPRGTPTGAPRPMPTPCPTPAIAPVLWGDIENQAPGETRLYIGRIFGDWWTNPRSIK